MLERHANHQQLGPAVCTEGGATGCVVLNCRRTQLSWELDEVAPTEQSPYLYNFLIATPTSESRKARVAKETEEAESTGNARHGTGRRFSRRQVPADDASIDELNPFYQDDDANDSTTELAWQICELTAMEEMDPTLRFELAQHRPLVKITRFCGKLDESEN
ncbi:hypothetical protein PHMEG_0008782 [Phytophthora megakarya]|uniref:Uncharacterized protein n=1 Tax=Phytophthora megakarya TaxID=4795 RepID=A0A225WI48_9STRA|nr:hypothetical protein PHMEG_0008782 [Phytophthora megakarya]